MTVEELWVMVILQYMPVCYSPEGTPVFYRYFTMQLLLFIFTVYYCFLDYSI